MFYRIFLYFFYKMFAQFNFYLYFLQPKIKSDVPICKQSTSQTYYCQISTIFNQPIKKKRL